jgi:hypothetical protein
MGSRQCVRTGGFCFFSWAAVCARAIDATQAQELSETRCQSGATHTRKPMVTQL